MKFRDWLLVTLVVAGLVAYNHPAWVQSLEQRFMNPAPTPTGTEPSFPPATPPRTAVNRTSAAPQSKVVRFVSIFDSPSMPDVGGHSIIGGLLTGKGLTAILPKLKVCARPKTAAAGPACTAVCKPGHQCLNQPFAGRGLMLSSSETAVVVNVFDVERPGTQQLIASFDADVAKCDANNHCKFGVVDKAKFGKDAAVEISFRPVSEPKGGPGTTDPTQSGPGPAPPNAVASGRECGDKTHGTFFDHSGLAPLYTDSNLEVWGGVSAYQNGQLVGGGVQPQPANDGITFTTKSCSGTPHVLQFVAREVILSNDQNAEYPLLPAGAASPY